MTTWKSNKDESRPQLCWLKCAELLLESGRVGVVVSGYFWSINMLVLLQGLKENVGYLVGDCLLAASFLSYMGPFLSNYRDELLDIWMTQVERSRILNHG